MSFKAGSSNPLQADLDGRGPTARYLAHGTHGPPDLATLLAVPVTAVPEVRGHLRRASPSDPHDRGDSRSHFAALAETLRLRSTAEGAFSFIAMRLDSFTSGRQATTPAPVHDCLFCRQADPSANRIAASNKTCFVRFDNFPALPGHVEIVPKRHVASFFDLTKGEVVDAYELLRAMQHRLESDHLADGFTIGVNEGRAAGRSVDHLHIHLIPRHFGDVADPRGGIRQIVPNCNPAAWSATTT